MYSKKTLKELEDVRAKLLEYNILASYPDATEEIIKKKRVLYEEYSRLNNLVVIDTTKKKKEPNRQVKFFNN